MLNVEPDVWALRSFVQGARGGGFDGLHNADFVHIHRLHMQFKSKHTRDVHMCSCPDMEPARTAVNALYATSRTHDASEVFAADQPCAHKCLHVRGFEEYASRHPLPNEPPPNSTPTIVVCNTSPCCISFKLENGRRICITTDAASQFQCGICHRSRRTACEHIREFKVAALMLRTSDPETYQCIRDVGSLGDDDDAPQNEVEEDDDEETEEEPCARLPYSKTPIPIDYSPPPFSGTQCIPDAHGECPMCHHSSPWGDPVLLNSNAKLFERNGVRRVAVCMRRCTACGCGEKYYDGFEDGVFSWSRETLFAHDVLFDYLDLLPECSVPFNAYHSCVRRRYRRRGQTLCDVKTLTRALQGFLALINIGCGHEFECPVCSTVPMRERVVIMDGKTMGFKRKYMQPYEPWVSSDTFPTRNTAEYCLIRTRTKKHSKLVSLLGLYIKGKIRSSRHPDAIQLQKEVQQAVPSLRPFVETFPCPVDHRPFLQCITTEYPISTVIQPHSVPKLREIVHRETLTPADLTYLQEHVPCILSVVASLKWTTFHHRALFDALLDLAERPQKEDAPHPPENLAALLRGLPEDERRRTERSMNGLTHMPAFPMVRRTKTRRTRAAEDTAMTCTKIVKRAPSLTPGMFALFCPHGICLGFQALKTFEGPSTAFDLLYTRFPEAPGVVVYDNACNLARLCTKLAPRHFARTLFLIDRFHFPCHKRCHRAFSMEYWKHRKTKLMTIGAVNSQVAEQANSKLEFIAKQSSFMNETNYMQYVRFFLTVCNRDIIASDSRLAVLYQTV